MGVRAVSPWGRLRLPAWLSCSLFLHAGMLALEMLGRRAHNDHPNNFSRSPPYTEDVKWLLGLAAKLGKE